MKIVKFGKKKKETKQPLLKCGKPKGSCIETMGTAKDWRRGSRKPENCKRVTVTFSIPQWLFDAMEAKSMSGGRSAYLQALLQKDLKLLAPSA